jgi:hypothetical protein
MNKEKLKLESEIENLEERHDLIRQKQPIDWDAKRDLRNQINDKKLQLFNLESDGYEHMTINDAEKLMKAFLNEEIPYGYEYFTDGLIEEEVDFHFAGFIFEHIQQHGGEGQGDSYWVIFSVTKNDKTRYFKVDGWYASYSGHELEYGSFFEVEPYERTIKDWREVK